MKPLPFSSFGSSSGNSNSQERADSSEKKPTILYIEDDPENRYVAKLRFEKSHDIYTVSNSREACSFLAERGKDIDVILWI